MTYPYWDRKELYELVWAQPLPKVAKQFGVSDVAIAKACRKLKVPVPGRGYWAKKANGHTVRTVPLPKAKDVPQVSKPQPRVPGEKSPIDPEDQQEIARIENLLRSGALDPDRQPWVEHSATSRTSKEARHAKEDWRHLLILPDECLNIRVTKGSLDRSVSLIGSIFGVCERKRDEGACC